MITSPVISYTPLILFNSKHLDHYNTPPHQDWRSMQGSLDSVVIWVALQDIEDGFGNIELIPCSHTSGLMKTEKDDWFRSISISNLKKKFISFDIKKGDAIVFSTFLIHQTGINNKNDIRWSLQFRFNNLDEKSFIKRGYPDPYIHKPSQNLISKNFPSEKGLNLFLILGMIYMENNIFFDSNSHPTVNGTWLNKKNINSFESLNKCIASNNLGGALAVGLDGVDSFERKSFIDKCIQFNNLVPIAGFSPHKHNSLNVLHDIKNLGYKGIKIHPRFSGFDLNKGKAQLIETIHTCQDLDLVILICTYF